MKIQLKKSTICMILFIIVILIIVFITNIVSGSGYNTESDNLYDYNEATENDSDIYSQSVNNSYGCLNKDYNYITNPSKLSTIDFLAVGLTSYGDYVNNIVQSLGYTDTQLEIVEISKKSCYITTKIQIGDTNSCITVTYNNMTNEFTYTVV